MLNLNHASALARSSGRPPKHRCRKTNIYVLIATALLGVLLIVVQQIGGDADVTPLDVPTPEPTETEETGEDWAEPSVEALPRRHGAGSPEQHAPDLEALLDATAA